MSTTRLIPARFLVTLGHLIAVLMVFKTKTDNAYAGLATDPTVAQLSAAEDSVSAALALAVVCFFFDFVGIIFGLSIFMPKVNLVQVILHFVGAVLVANFITEEWDYRLLWHIVGFCNIPTVLVELGVLVAVFVLKTVSY